MKIQKSLDDMLSSSAIGSVDRAIANALYGLNHRNTGNLVPFNRDQQGYAFIVRPQINLQKENISNVRRLYPLLSDNPWSVDRYVRCTLDPRIQAGYSFNTKPVSPANRAYYDSIGLHPNSVPPLSCDLVDERQCFIPLISNMVEKISGWPEAQVPTMSFEPGLFREKYVAVDGMMEVYDEYDLDLTFKGMKGNTLLYLLWAWTYYPTLLIGGQVARYPDYRSENRLDYTTRIWRLTMDEANETVSMLTASGASFWVTSNVAIFADYDRSQAILNPAKEFSVRLKCMGFQFFDPILVQEFNTTVTQFNPEMGDGLRDNEMIRVPKSWLNYFNFRGYPRINPNNMALEWYIDRNYFNLRSADFLSSNAGESFINEISDI